MAITEAEKRVVVQLEEALDVSSQKDNLIQDLNKILKQDFRLICFEEMNIGIMGRKR